MKKRKESPEEPKTLAEYVLTLKEGVALKPRTEGKRQGAAVPRREDRRRKG